MDRLNSLIDSINALAWGPPMIGTLGVTGVLLTLGLELMRWRAGRSRSPHLCAQRIGLSNHARF